MPTAISEDGRRVNLPTLAQVFRPDGSGVFPDALMEVAIRQMRDTNIGGVSFFTPDKAMVKWLATYAGNRIILDIGCGDGYLLRQLRIDAGFTRVAGIEPRWNGQVDLTINRWPLDWRLQVIEDTVQSRLGSSLIQAATPEKMLLVCCRPAHSGYCADALRLKPEGVEFLYITIPKNWDRYHDLQEFRDRAVLLEHEGQGNEQELVWSII